MRSRYRKTWAGFIWVVSSPILTFVVQSLIFKEIFKFNIEQYPLYLLAGLLPWFFISQSLNALTSSLVVSRDVLLAFKVEPTTIVAAQVLDQFISFLAAFFIVAVLLIVPQMGNYSFVRLMSIPLDFLLLFYFVLALTILLSFWHAFYRDIQFVVQFLMGLAFYLTPIFYSQAMFPEKYKWILKFNFFIPVVKLFQTSIYEWELQTWLTNVLYVAAINIVITVMIKLSFKKMRDFYIYV